ncbi:hypothetical protein LZ32DRAFT_612152 [Colletotrichum eremochloae]|nr:hypothetical protein LZ32DRAFT_612152 [Colletotrichum eremochloae]
MAQPPSSPFLAGQISCPSFPLHLDSIVIYRDISPHFDRCVAPQIKIYEVMRSPN